MADISECPVCFEDFKEPKLLPCSHTLCVKCLGNLEKNRTVTCPMCNAVHEVPERGVQAFTENQHAAQLAEYNKKLKEMERQMAEQTVDEEDEPVRQKEAAATENNLAKSVTETGHGGAKPKAKAGASVRPEAKQQQQQQQRQQQQQQQQQQQHQQQQALVAEANLLTFSRQRLAMMQCEYDQKRCSSCGRSGRVNQPGDTAGAESSETGLRTCTQCKTAKYCSRECQAKDWKAKHKAQCKEMGRLITNIQQLEQASETGHQVVRVQKLKATLVGEPWTIKVSRASPFVFVLGQDKQVMQYKMEESLVTAVHDSITGLEERVVCRKPFSNTSMGMCVLRRESEVFIAVACQVSDLYQIEFWTYPKPSRKPVYTFKATNDMVQKRLGVISAHHDKIYVSNVIDKTIDEFSAATFPIKPTGLKIPTGVRTGHVVRQICVLTSGGGIKNVVLRYSPQKGGDGKMNLKCVTLQGRELWDLGDDSRTVVDGVRFIPHSMCADERGRVYVCDRLGCRVVVVHQDCTLQTLVSTPSLPVSLAWCGARGQLLVTHASFGGGHLFEGAKCVTARFNIEPEEERARAEERTVRGGLLEDDMRNVVVTRQLDSIVTPYRSSLCNENQIVYCANTGSVVQFNSKGAQCAKRWLEKDEVILAMCAFERAGSPHVAFSCDLDQINRLEIKRLPVGTNSDKDLLYIAPGERFTALCFFEGHVFAANQSLEVIERFDAKSAQYSVPTGFKIPVRVPIVRMCATRKGKLRRLYYISGGRENYLHKSRTLECINMKGELLWSLDNTSPREPGLNEMLFIDVCADDNGNIFAVDAANNRVVAVREDRTTETLFQLNQSRIMHINWCDVTKRLYVIHVTETQLRRSCFTTVLNVNK